LDQDPLASNSVPSPIMSPIRTPAVVATDNGPRAPELAADIARVKGATSIDVSSGNWLSPKQSQALLNAPDIDDHQWLHRPRHHRAVLVGGARRWALFGRIDAGGDGRRTDPQPCRAVKV
jgi:hypothetical protein